jgi:hypothetical protein
MTYSLLSVPWVGQKLKGGQKARRSLITIGGAEGDRTLGLMTASLIKVKPTTKPRHTIKSNLSKKGYQWKKTDLARYLAKYVGKEMESELNERRYRCSLGIEIPGQT